MFLTKDVENIKTHILGLVTFYPKWSHLEDNLKKMFGAAGQATVDSIIRRIGFSCWLTKATHTHSEYVILIAFPQQQWLREGSSL